MPVLRCLCAVQRNSISALMSITNKRQSKHILICDADDTQVNRMQSWLANKSINVTVCHTVQSTHETITTARTGALGNIDALLLFASAKYDMLQLIEQCRRSDDYHYRDLPIIVVTEVRELELATRAIERGASDYLFKPLTEHVLMSKITTYLQLSSTQKKNEALMGRGNKYKQLYQTTQTSMRIQHEHEIQEKEKTIAQLTRQMSIYDPSKAATRTAALIETPIQAINKKLAALMNDKAIKDSAIYDELEELKQTLASANDIYAPDFKVHTQQAGTQANWLRSRFFSIYGTNSLAAPRGGKLPPVNGASAENATAATAAPTAGTANPTTPTTTMTLPKNMVSYSQACLDALERWDFNIFEFTADELLPCLPTLFHQMNVVLPFKLNEEKLMNLFFTVSKNYNMVPYHNVYHGVNVLQAVYVYLKHMGAQDYLTPTEIVSALVGALW